MSPSTLYVIFPSDVQKFLNTNLFLASFNSLILIFCQTFLVVDKSVLFNHFLVVNIRPLLLYRKNLWVWCGYNQCCLVKSVNPFRHLSFDSLSIREQEYNFSWNIISVWNDNLSASSVKPWTFSSKIILSYFLIWWTSNSWNLAEINWTNSVKLFSYWSFLI